MIGRRDRMGWHDLIKRLVACDHAKLTASALLERLHPVFQVTHFRRELPVSLDTLVIIGSLRRDRSLETPQFAETILGEPDSVLQEHHDDEQGCCEPLHGRDSIKRDAKSTLSGMMIRLLCMLVLATGVTYAAAPPAATTSVDESPTEEV